MMGSGRPLRMALWRHWPVVGNGGGREMIAPFGVVRPALRVRAHVNGDSIRRSTHPSQPQTEQNSAYHPQPTQRSRPMGMKQAPGRDAFFSCFPHPLFRPNQDHATGAMATRAGATRHPIDSTHQHAKPMIRSKRDSAMAALSFAFASPPEVDDQPDSIAPCHSNASVLLHTGSRSPEPVPSPCLLLRPAHNRHLPPTLAP